MKKAIIAIKSDLQWWGIFVAWMIHLFVGPTSWFLLFAEGIGVQLKFWSRPWWLYFPLISYLVLSLGLFTILSATHALHVSRKKYSILGGGLVVYLFVVVSMAIWDLSTETIGDGLDLFAPWIVLFAQLFFVALHISLLAIRYCHERIHNHA